MTVNRFYASVLNAVKEDIRRSLLKRRRSLSKEELKQVSCEINTHLINEIQNRDLKKILVYQSIDNEPSIKQTTELAWQKDIEVYIPKVISKEKIIINRSQKDGSGTGQNTLGDGLTTSSIYGTRVQDKEICLNFPDAVSYTHLTLPTSDLV